VRPTRVIIRAALACALAIAAVLPSAPADHPDASAPATVVAGVDTADICDRDDPYPVQQVDASPLIVKPPCHGEGSTLLDGTLPAVAGTPGLARLAELRPRSHLPRGRAGGVDTRPA
jgi:hypothetical protein